MLHAWLACLVLAAFAVVPAARAAEPPAVARARALAASLPVGPGRRPAVVVSPGDDPEYLDKPAYAVYRFRRSRCDLYVNDAAVAKYDFEDDFSFRFMIYHELSHCYLYVNPRPITAFPGAGERANRLISDLVELEYLQSDVPGRVNGYNGYQETFADVRAVALLAAEGQPRERLDRLLAYRRGAAVSPVDPHDDAEAIEQALAVPWASLGPEELDARVRAIADAQVPRAFLARAFNTDDVPFAASDLVAAELRGPLSDLRFQYADPGARAQAQGKLADVESSAWPVWRLYARLAGQGLDDDALISRFFQERYGAAPSQLAQEDAALRSALAR